MSDKPEQGAESAQTHGGGARPPVVNDNPSGLFFFLFALNILSLLMIARVNQLLQEEYVELAASHALWDSASQRGAALSKAAQDAAAPANDIFDNLHYDTERARLLAASANFYKLIDEERKLLADLPVRAQRDRLMANLADAEMQFRRMVEASEKVFTSFAHGKKREAGAHMATADHLHRGFSDTMAIRASLISGIQSDLFLQGEQYRKGLGRLALSGALIIAALAGFLAIYGGQLSRKMRQTVASVRLGEDRLRHSEAELRKSNIHLERMLASQSRFVGAAAHQLRTPIAGIRIQVERALKATDPADTHAALEQVDIASRRLVNLSNQLLTLASVDQESPGNIRFEKINLVELVREVGFRWIDVALKKNIDIEFIEREAVVEVNANPLLLEELVSNLIDNAIRYSPKGTRTAITVLPGPGPQILVEDEGQGIPADSRERVFERFYRMSEAGTEGSGLGLAIVRDIARLHRAEVSIESRESGLGTRVRVSFPP